MTLAFVAFDVLHKAHSCAVDTRSDIWDFAVEISHLRSLGLSDTDLRWLVRKGYVQHAREVTIRGDDGRAFRSTGDLTFSPCTCFVLTSEGVSKARSVTDSQETSATHASSCRPMEVGQVRTRACALA